MQHRKTFKILRVSLLAMGSLAVAQDGTLRAEESASNAVASVAAAGRPDLVAFNIPEQPLAIALDLFGTQADLQVLYESTLAEGRRSAPLIGSFTRDEGLRHLLAGTGLIASHSDAKNIILHPIVPIRVENDAAPAPAAHLALHALRVEAPMPADFSAYDGVIALDLQKALRRNEKTRHGTYAVNARIWIDTVGAVRRVELASSTGDEVRDDAVFHTLQTFVVSRLPPANLPEPVTVSIVVKPL